CNCGYMTHTAASGRGIARRMCEHSLEHARSLGYRAMQFNFVVSTNERAVRLWLSLGFAVVGRLPAAFRHPSQGDCDALIMYRSRGRSSCHCMASRSHGGLSGLTHSTGGWGPLVRGAVEIVQAAIGQSIDPAVNGEFLLSFPGASYNR